MAKEVVESLVDAGNASAGPPLGPAIGPTGLNIGQVVNAINEKTKDFKGMKVPIQVIIDTDTREYEIKVGSPPTSSLVKKELGIEKGRASGAPVADLSFDQLLKVAKMKQDGLLANDLKAAVKEVVGTCTSVGVTIEGMTTKEFIKAFDEGGFDDRL